MISVLIPIYNGIEFIEESVGSVLEQTFTDWELLIGVNGHPENSETYQLAKKYEQTNKIRVFDFYNINGKSNTLNELIKYCNGEYVALLDVDDIWTSEKLQIQSAHLYSYDVIGSNCVYFGEQTGVTPPIPLNDASGHDFKNSNPIINSSAIIRKELCFWQYEGLEDYELWLRLKSQNKTFYNCSEITVKHRIHNNSAFNSTEKQEVLIKELLSQY